MKALALRFLYTTAYYLGIFHLLVYFSRRPIVVTYHNIIEDELFDKNVHLTLTHRASVFDRQISIIQKLFSIVSDLEPGKVLITFDDGYRNNRSVVVPIMQRYGITGTFFIPASYFDDGGTLWIDRMLMWLAHVPSGKYEVLGLSISTQSEADRKLALDALWRFLVEDYTNKDKVLDALERAHSFDSLEIDEDFRAQRYTVLTGEDVSALNDAGCRTACHSYGHDILSQLTDEQLDEDFQRCLAHKGRYNSDWYGYPFGRPAEVSSRVVEKCKKSGFSMAFVNTSTSSDCRFRIPRINMPETGDEVAIYAKLSGFEAMLKTILRM